MKLTTQAQVVQHMKDGWKLGYSHFGNCYWLQKPDLCEGGEHKKVIAFWTDRKSRHPLAGMF
jgi:hypothetical protein